MAEPTWKEPLRGLEYERAQREGGDDPILAAELAMVRRAPPIDAVLAGAASPSDARLVAGAVRALVAMGAVGRARAFLEQAEDVLASSERELLLSQIERRDGRSTSSEGHAVHVALAARDVRAIEAAAERCASAALGPLASASEVDERRASLSLLAGIARARGDFAAAARHTDAVVREAPLADDAAVDRIAVAFDRFLAADRPAAVEALRAARARITERGSRGYYTEQSTGALLDAIEGAAGPRVVSCRADAARTTLAAGDGGRAVVDLVQSALGELRPPADRADGGSSAPCPTMAHVARELEARGFRLARVTCDLDLLERLVGREGVLVFLEEERSIGRGFRVVLDVELAARLLVVREPASIATAVLSWGQEELRLALYGKSALVVFADGDTAAAAEVRDDARLRELDRAEVDEDGDAPPVALVTRITDALLEADPDFEPARYRKGLLLLPDARQRPDEFIRWYATARERFPEAELPVQLYAQFLAGRGNNAEAALAWLEAWQRDPGDVRNAAGHGAALYRLGETRAAEVAFRRAATLAPADPAHVYWQAQVAIARGDLSRAEELATIGKEVEQPDNAWPESLLTTIFERRGDLDRAFEAMKAASTKEPSDAWAACRVARHHVRRGELPLADEVLSRARARSDISTEAQRDVDQLRVEVLVASGDVDGAWKLALTAVDEHAPTWEVYEEACKLLPFLADESRAAAISALGERVAKTGDGDFVWLCLKYIERSAPTLARSFCEGLRAASMDATTVGWNEARALLRSRDAGDRALAKQRLLEVIEQARSFEPLVVYTAAALVDDPKAMLEHLRIDSRQYPAAVWLLQARGLEATGEARVAAGIRERWAELSADDCLSSAAWLATGRFVDLATELVERARALAPDHEQIPFVELRLGLTAADRTKLRAVVDALAARGMPPSATWSQGLVALEAALRVGAPDAIGVAARALQAVLKDSRTSGDPWVVRAALAAAAAARGDRGERDAVLAGAPRDPYARRALAKAEEILGVADHDADREALFEIAPGARSTFAREEVLPWTTI